ncbi:MAG: hypothetical protein D6785_13265 [Planctomycetota bacterium]|nr:MAG: hypothetical protein D6785_13265 [Planctomycetota bacterium]
MAKKKGTQKLSSLKTSKSKAVSTRSSGRASTKMKSQKASKRTAPPPPPKASAAAVFPIYCSECLYEYEVSSSVDADTITCPLCGHSCKTPDDEFFGKYSLHMSSEKKHGNIGVFLAILWVVLAAGWIALLMHPGWAMKTSLAVMEGDKINYQNLNYAFLGALFLITVFLAIEANNHEKSIYRGFF